jgi:hypothetical protein
MKGMNKGRDGKRNRLSRRAMELLNKKRDRRALWQAKAKPSVVKPPETSGDNTVKSPHRSPSGITPTD